jgi:hypothetical protein
VNIAKKIHFKGTVSREGVHIPRETGVSRLSPLSSSFLAELWRRGEEGGEVVGDGVEMFDICSDNRNGIGSSKTFPKTVNRLFSFDT